MSPENAGGSCRALRYTGIWQATARFAAARRQYFSSPTREVQFQFEKPSAKPSMKRLRTSWRSLSSGSAGGRSTSAFCAGNRQTASDTEAETNPK